MILMTHRGFRLIAGSLTAVLIGAALDDRATAQAISTTLSVNIYNQRHAISPYIYGGNFPKGDHYIEDTGMRLSRWGGNNMSTYNWKLKAANIDSDWFFENWGGDDSVGWVKRVVDHGSVAIFTIPMLDWVPKDTESNSYSIKKYGPQEKSDSGGRADAGNGKTTDGKPILTNDPHDAYVPLLDHPGPNDPPGAVYRDEWVKAIAAAFGNTPHFYEADNEPEIWGETHQDCHPKPVTYDELRDKFIETSQTIKEADPKALVAGPITCAWWFYWNSAAGGADKAAHDGIDFIPWWIGAVQADDQAHHRRSLDILDIHAYADYNGNGSADAVAASRLRSPRMYWDPSYKSEGYIGTSQGVTSTQPNPNAAAIVPRFKAMLNGIYPCTEKVAISEWAVGPSEDYPCALAEGDIYGAFGRENLFAATRFEAPKDNTPTCRALTLYKNFEPISIDASNGLSADEFTSYSSVSADGRSLTIMAINKNPTRVVTASLKFEGFKPATMQVDAITAGQPLIQSSAPTEAPSTYTFPPYSQTLLRFTGTTEKQAVDWSVDPDDLMLPAGSTGHLSPKIDSSGSVRLISVSCDGGPKLRIANARMSKGHDGAIAIEAGSTPGFYRYTVAAKTSTGLLEQQSGWIVVGAKGSMPETR